MLALFFGGASHVIGPLWLVHPFTFYLLVSHSLSCLLFSLLIGHWWPFCCQVVGLACRGEDPLNWGSLFWVGSALGWWAFRPCLAGGSSYSLAFSHVFHQFCERCAHFVRHPPLSVFVHMMYWFLLYMCLNPCCAFIIILLSVTCHIHRLCPS